MLPSDAREDAMSTEHEDGGSSGIRTFAAGLMIGALLGAGVALLFAPQSGEETRRVISRRARRLAEDAREQYDEAKHRLRRARERRRRDQGEVSAG